MKKIFILVMFNFFVSLVYSQMHGWEDAGPTNNNGINAAIEGKILVLDNYSTSTSEKMYAAGEFKNSNNHCYVAEYDISTKTWTELGGLDALSANGKIKCMAIDKQNGNIFIAGEFTNINGEYYVAKWNGTNWQELGGLINGIKANDIITSLAVDKFGTVYAAGNFNDGTYTLHNNYYSNTYVAKYSSGWSKAGQKFPLIQRVSTGFRASEPKIAVDNNADLFLARCKFGDENIDPLAILSGQAYGSFSAVYKLSGNNWQMLGNGTYQNGLFDINRSLGITNLLIDSKHNRLYAAMSSENNLINPITSQQFNGCILYFNINSSNFATEPWHTPFTTSISEHPSFGVQKSYCPKSCFFTQAARGLMDMKCDADGNIYLFEEYTTNPSNSATGTCQMFKYDFDNDLLNTVDYCVQSPYYIFPLNKNTSSNNIAFEHLNCIATDSKGNIYTAGNFKNINNKLYVSVFNLQRNIKPQSSLPTQTQANISLCANKTYTIADIKNNIQISVLKSVLLWYDVSTGGFALDDTYSFSGIAGTSKDFYIAQKSPCADVSNRIKFTVHFTGPTFTLTNPSPVCANTSFNITASDPNLNYAWSVTSGTPPAATPVTCTAPCKDINQTLANAGTYTYSATATDGNNCKSTQSVSVVVNAAPDFSITAPAEACEGIPYDLSVSSTTYHGGYSWYRDLTYSGGNFQQIPCSNSPTPCTKITENNSEEYYTYTVTATQNGCSTTHTATVRVNLLESLDDYPKEICKGTSVTIDPTATSNATPGGTWVYGNASLNPHVITFTQTQQGVVTIKGDNLGTESIYYYDGTKPCPYFIRIDVTDKDCPSVCDDKCYWSLYGNKINGQADAKVNTFGTLTEDQVRIKTTDRDRGLLTRDGRLGWNTKYDNDGTKTVSTLLHVNCSVTEPWMDDLFNGQRKSAIRLENLQESDGREKPVLVIDDEGYVYKSIKDKAQKSSGSSDARIEKMQKQIDELKLQVKALLEAKSYSPCNVAQPMQGNSLEIVPTPFAQNAKAVYSLENFSGEAQLQVTDVSGRLLKTYSISQAKGQVEVGDIPAVSTTVIFNIVSNGKLLVSKKSIKAGN